MNLRCQLCGELLHGTDIREAISEYLIHTVKMHWSEVVLLHHADSETLNLVREILRRESQENG